MYYYLGLERETLGPVSFESIREMTATGVLGPDDLLWTEGWEDWRPARTVAGLFADESGASGEGASGAGASGVGASGVGSSGVGATPPVQPGRVGVAYPAPVSNSTWAIPAMPSAGYEPGVFGKLSTWYVWLLVVALGAYALLVAAAVVMAVLAPRGEGPMAAGMVAVIVVSTLASLAMLAPMIIWYVLFYKMWRQIQDGHARTGPGKAVGFLFIPYFNYYWNFVAVKGLPEDLIAYAQRWRVSIPEVKPELGMWLSVLLIIAGVVPCVGLLAALALVPVGIIYTKQCANASDAIAAHLARGLGPSGAAFGGATG